jgi:hypothetical protein
MYLPHAKRHMEWMNFFQPSQFETNLCWTNYLVINNAGTGKTGNDPNNLAVKADKTKQSFFIFFIFLYIYNYYYFDWCGHTHKVI